jgi:hypothetical protein
VNRGEPHRRGVCLNDKTKLKRAIARICGLIDTTRMGIRRAKDDPIFPVFLIFLFMY